MRIVIAVLATALVATAAEAGVPDHLQCYELKNANLRGLRGVVDLDAPAFGLAPGCRISRAKLYCVPAEAAVQPGTLADGGRPLDEILYQGRPTETDRICYRVKCPYPAGAAPDQTVTDRFATHRFKQLRTEMLCTPANGGTLPPPRDGFRIEFPEVEVFPGQDVSYCYYFRTPNAVTLPVARFTSEMGPFVQTMIAFTTTTAGTPTFPVDRLPPGTVSAADCTPLPTMPGVVPHWLYQAHESPSELAFPSDDGTGKPLALEIPPLSSGFILLHAVNTSGDVITTSAALNVEPVAGSVYTRTDTFTAYSKDFGIPPLATNFVETKSCTAPQGAQFWRLSTLAHKRAVETRILDGANLVLSSTDWAHPAAETLPLPPFRAFANKLQYACRYDNPENRTVFQGDSFQTDEECLAVGYYFPATRPLRCHNGSGPF